MRSRCLETGSCSQGRSTGTQMRRNAAECLSPPQLLFSRLGCSAGEMIRILRASFHQEECARKKDYKFRNLVFITNDMLE